MTIWVPRLDQHLPRYQAIAEAIARDLAEGLLKPGERLPTHRDLAYRLGVTTGTVTRAYAEAEKQGLLVGEVGRGSYLRNPAEAETNAAAMAEPEVADLSQASPPHILSASVLDEAMQRLMALPHRTSFLDYTPAEGHAGHRAMGAVWLERGGVRVSEQQVVVTSGAHGGLIAVLAALCKPGDAVLAEGLNYPTLKPIARHMGLTLLPLPSDDEGLLPEELERQAAAGIAKFLYIVPTLQNPTTNTLTAERRTRIVEIARKHGLTIIEDDIFRLLAPPEQSPTLFSLAPERCYHITSISKTVAAGLRVGFVATPESKSEAVLRSQTFMGARATGLAAEIARQWIAGEEAKRIHAAIVAENARRRDIALETFAGRDFRCEPGAPYVWLKLPPAWTASEFVRAALERRIRVTPGNVFAIAPQTNEDHIRICLGGRISVDRLRASLATLNDLMDARPGEDPGSLA